MSAPAPGQLFVGCQNDAIYLVTHQPASSNDHPQHDGPSEAIAKVYDQAHAERLALCWNAHQGLLEALEAVVASYDGLDCSCLPATTEPDGLILPRALCLPCRAHAALAAARGGMCGV